MSDHEPLAEVERYARSFLDGLGERPVKASAGVDELRALLDRDLPEEGLDPATVIAEMVKGAESGVVATTSPRFFGFVIGGHSEVSLAADWLTSLWDQNAGLFAAGPSASVIEEVAGRWIKEILRIPPHASLAFVTGTQMAHFTCLAAARHHLLAQLGWDVEADGLTGAPPLRVLTGGEYHVTVSRALRFLGIGTGSIVPVACDGQGRVRSDDLLSTLGDSDRPTIVCLQAGNVNTGCFDPIADVVDAAHSAGAWVHLDGAFGLWAAASPELSSLLEGSEDVDSWATDAHKWLNVPYDSALAFCAHPEAHNQAIGVHASYLMHSKGRRERDEMDWTPEFSRRARGFTVYAQLLALGRSGVREVVERCCRCARRFAEGLGHERGIEVVNDVVLNQVLVRFGRDDDLTRRVVRRIQEDGTLWLSGSVWQGTQVMRISVSNAGTTEADVDRSVEAILAAFRAEERRNQT